MLKKSVLPSRYKSMQSKGFKHSFLIHFFSPGLSLCQCENVMHLA